MVGYIKFYAPVTANTAIQLQQTVEQLLRQGLSSLHLLLSTPGGSVYVGMQMMPGGMPVFRGLSVPEPQNYTAITNSYSSIISY